jgi:hypothetical protein
LAQHDLDYWIGRYEKLFDILNSSAARASGSRGCIFEVARATRSKTEVGQGVWPPDFEAFRLVFDDKISTNGYDLILVEWPEKYQNSEVFEIFYSVAVEGDGERIIGPNGLKVKDVYWCGKGSSSWTVFGFFVQEKQTKFIVTDTPVAETFSAFLSEELKGVITTLPDELADSIEGWIKL